MNTIAARITKNEELLNSYGVALYDTEGQLRSTFNILSDLSNIWGTLSDSEQVALGQQLAGINQYKVFSAVMGNFNTALEAEQVALNSAGSAARENSKYMESIQAHTAKFNSAFNKLANDLLSSDMVKFFIDLGTALLKVADTGLGRFVIKSTALGVVLGGLPLLIISIVKGIKDFTKSTIESIATVVKKTKATIEDTIALKANTAAQIENNKAKQDGTLRTWMQTEGAGVDWASKAKALMAGGTAKSGEVFVEEAAFGASTAVAGVGALVAILAAMSAQYEKSRPTVEKYTNALEKQSQAVSDLEAKIRQLQEEDAPAGVINAYTEQLKQLKEEEIEFKKTEWEKFFTMTPTTGSMEQEADGTIKYYTELDDAISNFYDKKDRFEKANTHNYETRKEEYNEEKNNLWELYKINEEYITYVESTGDVVPKAAINARERLENVLGITRELTQAEQEEAEVKEYSVLSSQAYSQALADELYAIGMNKNEYDNLTNAIQIFNSTNLDTAGKIGALNSIASAAQGASLQFIQSILSMYKALAGDRWGIMAQTDPTAIALLNAAAEAKSIGGYSQGYGLTSVNVTAPTTSTTSTGGTTTSTTDKYKEAFNAEYEALKHNLTMEYITEEQYYNSLEKLYKKYFAGKSEYQSEAWKYEEEVYKGRKKLEEDLVEKQKQSIEDYYNAKIDALKETNSELDKEYDLQQALLDLETAREKRLLVYRDGKFVYETDYEAVASASYNVQKLQRQAAIEALEAEKQSALAKFANGTTSAGGGLSLVGEKGAELRVLNRGDGIIPSHLTANLMELGKYSPRELLNGSGEQFIFNGSLMFPNVTNTSGIENFVNGVKQLAYQKAYQRG